MTTFPKSATKSRAAAELSAVLRAAIEDPATIDEAPDSVTVLLFPDDDDAAIERSIRLGLHELREGRSVTFRRISRDELDGLLAREADTA